MRGDSVYGDARRVQWFTVNLTRRSKALKCEMSLEVKGQALVQRYKRQLKAMSAAFGMGLRVDE